MEAEIRTLSVQFEQLLNNLNLYKRQLIQKVSSMFRQQRYKIQYLKQINTWYENYKQHLIQQYDKKIKQIYEKYSTLANTPTPTPTPTPTKRACLIGINYTNTDNELYGCVNDVAKIKDMLETKYNYLSNNVTTLLNAAATRNNILNEFTTLIKSANEGDTLFVSYSGHGSSTPDRNKDEIDGVDELIVSVDYYAILDDELKQIIDKYLKPNVKLFTLFDSCHSGTMLDLPYQYYKTDSNEPIIHPNCSETKGEVICLSGCKDDQTSMDAYINANYNGAMTWAFVDVLSKNNNNKLSWKLLIEQIRTTLQTGNFDQLPQLTSGVKSDYAVKLVSL